VGKNNIIDTIVVEALKNGAEKMIVAFAESTPDDAFVKCLMRHHDDYGEFDYLAASKEIKQRMVNQSKKFGKRLVDNLGAAQPTQPQGGAENE